MRSSLLGLFALVSLATRLLSEDGPKLDALPPPFTADEFKKHAVFLSSDELAGRAVGSDGWKKGGDYVIRGFQDAGLKPLQADGSWFQPFRLVLANGTDTGKNILAVFPGKGDLKDQTVIVSAHLDHLGIREDVKKGDDAILNGADDNASGVSAMLLVSRALGLQKQKLPASHRTVIFASFGAEEHGLLGAWHYVNNPIWPLEQTAAIINFDSMGRLRMGKVYASDAETNPLLAKVATEAAKSRGLVAETRFGGHGRSDHAAFLDRNIPGMHFFTGANSDYHQVTDEWQTLNMEGGAAIARISWQVLQTAMTTPEKLKFEKPSPLFDMQFALNVVKTMGIVPMVHAQEGRYPQIMFVIPNTPAAKYGIQSGDQITAINGIRFNRVEDALTIFPQLTFDEGTLITILRGGEEVEVKIPASFYEEMTGPKASLLENGNYEINVRYQPPASVKTVYLAGEFNQWKPNALKMDGPDANGAFTTRMELKPGVYEYKFVHEGKDWAADPGNLYQVGKYGNSVMWVGKERK